MNILHLSDFHFGDQSLQNDTIYPTIPEDFIYKTQKFIEISVDRPDLVIFTGDLISKGKTSDFNNPFILDFLKPFIDSSIPILICNGNHDLVENRIKTKNQFLDYTNFIISNNDKFQMTLSKKFLENQASYIDFPLENFLFISLNSSHNIITNKDQDYKKQPTLPLKITEEFINEIEQNIGEEFESRNKIVIIHHPLEKLKIHNDSIKMLKNNHVKLIFGGDSHKFSRDIHEGILGFTAGTLYGSNSIRWDQLNLVMQPNQFNFYKLLPNQDIITIFQNIHDLMNGEWRIYTEKNENIQMQHYWSIEKFCSDFNLASYIKVFHEMGVKGIFKDEINGFDFFTFDNNNRKIDLFLLETKDQYKVELIKKVIKEKIHQNNIIIKIIDKTQELQFQIDTFFIVSDKK